MTTKRYVLFKPAHAGEVADGDRYRIESLAQVVDSVGPRAFLVEVPEERVASLRQQLEGWTVEEEVVHPHPKDPRR